MNNDITTANLMRSLPAVLANDETMNAYSKVFADELVVIKQEVVQAIIYNRIDMLPEKVLDALAYDFKVDWYEYDFSIQVKRALIKDCVNVHKRLGTRYAVETALSDIYSKASVLEWFEYGGGPYHFKIRVIQPWESEAQVGKVIRTIERVKSKRSRLDGITFVTESNYARCLYFGHALVLGGSVTIAPWTYEQPDIRSTPKLAHALAIHGTTTINRGESA